jgi:hypothetical protein
MHGGVRLHQLQVNLGFAAACDAVENKGPEARRPANRLERPTLMVI